MMKRYMWMIAVGVSAVMLFAAGCSNGGGDAAKNADKAVEAPKDGVASEKVELSDPKAAIELQFNLLKEGKAVELKTHFTERLQDMITEEMVKDAQSEVNEYTIDDLVASTEELMVEGDKAVKIKMSNGRTLTTLIQKDGKWLADTIWFK